MENRSTFSLIGDRYLDTTHDAAYIEGLEDERPSRRGRRLRSRHFGTCAALAGFLFGPLWAAVAFLLLHLVTTWMGFEAWKGSRKEA